MKSIIRRGNTPRKWSEDDDALLLSGVELHVAAEILRRTFGACQDRLCKLNAGKVIKKKRRSNGWTDTELSLLEELTEEGYADESISHVLGRSLNSLQTRRKLMKKERVAEEKGLPYFNVYAGLKAKDYGFDPKVGADPDKYWAMKMGVS